LKAKLVFLSGTRSGTSVTLSETTTVGRRSNHAIRFDPDEILVSGDHAVIEPRGDHMVLRDLGSRNGTIVNGERIAGEHVLVPGDVIEFGPGGPCAQFASLDDDVLTPTLDLDGRATVADILRQARERASQEGSSSGSVMRRFSATREFAVQAYKKTSTRSKVMTVGLALLTGIGLGGVMYWQARDKAELRSALERLALDLQTERGSRTLIEQNLATIRSSYDSLLDEVERRGGELERRATGGARFAETVTRNYADGVALITFSYGFVRRGSDELLRFLVDESGQPVIGRTRDGRPVPRFDFGGNGPPLARQGTASGFLVDSAGWILTNRHVARPWENSEDLDYFRLNGLDVEARFIELRAYFPPGDKSYPLSVYRTSQIADVASLRTTNRRIDAPVIPLAADTARVPPGEQILFLGYPTGVHNLLFRIPSAERLKILEASGEDPLPLAQELARRRLIQPLVIGGSVSDTTMTEIIHTAGTTGGGSGGPLIGSNQRAIAIHYAAVRSPIEGDPFQTQRGIRIRYAWRLFPDDVTERMRR